MNLKPPGSSPGSKRHNSKGLQTEEQAASGEDLAVAGIKSDAIQSSVSSKSANSKWNPARGYDDMIARGDFMRRMKKNP
jgi:hypothetical protein